MGVASQNSTLTPVCDNKFPSLVASLFSWRCLAASTSSFLYAAMNLRLPSVTVSTHTSAFNAVAFQSPAMPNARMSLWTQSVHSFSFPARPLRNPQGFQKRFASAAARRSFGGASPPAKVFSFATSSQCPYTRLSQGHGCTKSSDGLVSCVWSLALCPDYTKQDSVVYDAEFGVVFLAKDSRTASIQEQGLDCLRLNHSGLEGERDFRLVVELP